MSTPIRLMLIDDHAIVRAGLRALFDDQADMTIVAEADSTRDALKKIDTVTPDVLILDLTMPGGGSLDLIRALHEHPTAPRTLVFTMHDAGSYARSALSAGATGYVVKTVSETDLLAAVRSVARGRIFIDLDNPRATAEVYAHATLPRGAVGLSQRELEVLSLLGHGHSNREIADKLDISAKTVATYKARITEKVGLKSTADFVKFASDNGLTNDEPKQSSEPES
jgi:two-component system response regulator NreC